MKSIIADECLAIALVMFTGCATQSAMTVRHQTIANATLTVRLPKHAPVGSPVPVSMKLEHRAPDDVSIGSWNRRTLICVNRDFFAMVEAGYGDPRFQTPAGLEGPAAAVWEARRGNSVSRLSEITTVLPASSVKTGTNALSVVMEVLAPGRKLPLEFHVGPIPFDVRGN